LGNGFPSSDYIFEIAFRFSSNINDICYLHTAIRVNADQIIIPSTFFDTHKVNRIVLNHIYPNGNNSDCNFSLAANGFIEFKNFNYGSNTYPIKTTYPLNVDFNLPVCKKFINTKSLVFDDHINNNSFINLSRITPNWKQQSNYVFKEQRQYSMPANRKGIFNDYPSGSSSSNTIKNGFFTSNNGTISGENGWKKTEESTLFDPYNGSEVESRDALNRYRSIVYDRNSNSFFSKGTTPNLNSGNTTLYFGNDVAVGTNPQLYIENGRHSEATAFNFENEQELKTDKLTCYNDNHYFTKDVANEDILLSNTFSHTGNQSIKVKGNVVSETFVSQGYNIAPDVTFMKDAIIPFYPQLGKQIISGWIKSSKPFYDLSNNLSYCKVELLSNVTDDGIGNSIIVNPTGPVINGWQRFYAVFDIANQASPIAKQVFSLRLTLSSGGENEIAYFDDIRIQPYNANVKNYVYDKLKRVSAVLDENNYATFYQYDMKGELVSIKKETEKGIVTIKETRKTLSNINN